MRNAATKRISFSGLFILSLLINSNAQETANGNSYQKSCYGYWGYGFGGQGTAMNFGFVTESKNGTVFSYSLQRTWLARPETVETMSVMGTAKVSSVKQTASGTSSLLLGKILKQPWGHFLLMAGPSLARITQYDQSGWYSPKYSGEIVSRPGLSLQASATPSKNFIGVSAHSFVNINSEFTHAGITINLVLGKVNYTRREEK